MYKIAHEAQARTTLHRIQSLVSGEEGQEIKVGKSEVNRPLNRFRNITACKNLFGVYVS